MANCVQKNGLILGPIPKISQIFLKKTGYQTGYKSEPADKQDPVSGFGFPKPRTKVPRFLAKNRKTGPG
jgi:hypothetical protein